MLCEIVRCLLRYRFRGHATRFCDPILPFAGEEIGLQIGARILLIVLEPPDHVPIVAFLSPGVGEPHVKVDFVYELVRLLTDRPSVYWAAVLVPVAGIDESVALTWTASLASGLCFYPGRFEIAFNPSSPSIAITFCSTVSSL